MIVSINAQVMPGAWGGGNQAVKSILHALQKRGHSVINHLKHPRIDLILMIHPDKNLEIITYGVDDICYYLRLHPNTLLLHRVNTSGDAHRGSGNESDELLLANNAADFTVFISSYLRELFIEKGFDPSRPHCVILNGADTDVFNAEGAPPRGPRWGVVTHHWSSNYMKGYDIYERLDQLLDTEPYASLFTFTLIGNIPKGLRFKNTKVVDPLAGQELAAKIKENQIYLTASRNEGAGMHHIEGMMCGLPVLYLNSGALSEYCRDYGLDFNLVNFESRLMEMSAKYDLFHEKLMCCPYSSENMAEQYVNVMEDLILRRKELPSKSASVTDKLSVHLWEKPMSRAYRLLKIVNKASLLLRRSL